MKASIFRVPVISEDTIAVCPSMVLLCCERRGIRVTTAVKYMYYERRGVWVTTAVKF